MMCSSRFFGTSGFNTNFNLLYNLQLRLKSINKPVEAGGQD